MSYGNSAEQRDAAFLSRKLSKTQLSPPDSPAWGRAQEPSSPAQGSRKHPLAHGLTEPAGGSSPLPTLFVRINCVF